MEGQQAKFDLTLSASQTPRGIGLTMHYSTDLFEERTVARMLERFQVLLEGALDAPHEALSRLPLMPAAEAELVRGWNRSDVLEDSNRTLHELFEREAWRRPHAVAARHEERAIGHRELNRRANQLARRLRALGVGSETRVAVCLERSLEMPLAVLGVLKAGGCYVPLDPAFPKERLGNILEDSQAHLVLTVADLKPGLPQAWIGRALCLDTDWPEIANLSTRKPQVPVPPAGAAYVLYTSGSTGRPKGVVVEHRQVVAYVNAFRQRTGLARRLAHAMLQPLTVDSSVTVLWGSLLTGGTLHLLSRERATDAHLLAGYFDRHPIDVLKIAPSHLAALQTAGQAGALMPRRLLVVGGEGSRWDWMRTLPGLRPGCAVFNHYGPTETTVGVAMNRIDPEVPAGAHVLTPLGRALPGTQLYVLDPRLQPVPIGVPGELYVGGALVARGYLNRPELTAEAFLPDPFGTESGGRLYRTGDLCRFLDDGRVEFLGRSDHQVKIRGFRIELGEVEAALARHPAVTDAVVLSRDDARGEKQLVGYVASNGHGAPGARTLRAWLRDQLPDFMVPAVIMVIPSLPLTPHGKVDLRALPEPRPDASPTDQFVAPTDDTEAEVARIWASVLGVEKVGAQDDFFELGGHSLLATQVVARVREQFSMDLPLRRVFETPTVAGLAEAIRAGRSNGAHP
jgi:amino acid adenylation domain-containing protein